MKDNRFFQKHHSKLVIEGIIKASLCGLIVGFAANFVTALVAWFFGFGGIWLAIGVGVAAGIVAGIIFYFKKFRPTSREIAGRVDRLGLEERLITMLEFENDDSYIAQRQREDARAHMADVSNKKVKFRLSKLMICLAVAATIVGSSMTVVTGLASHGVVPSGTDLIKPEEEKNFKSVTYVVEEGGEIIGETDQLVEPGKDATPVVAVANDGWVFFAWDDGYEYPERQDLNIREDIEVIAVFVEITEDGDDDNPDSNLPIPPEGDAPSDVPAEEGGPAQGSGSESDGGEQGDASGDGDGMDGDKEDSDNEGQGQGQGMGAGGKWEDSNQFLDGNQYYRDFLEQYYEMALQYFEENGEIPPELREFFETYFGSL